MKFFLNKFIYPLIESVIRNIGGGAGQRIRYFYYKNRFKACGSNVRIDVGVVFIYPDSIVVGNNVWIASYSLVTGYFKDKPKANRYVIQKKNLNKNILLNTLVIGNNTSIGPFNIISGYGGLSIGNYVTTSARVSIYSYSHMPSVKKIPNLVTYANSMVEGKPISCISSPIIIEDGVWLGLGTIVFGGTIGKYAFSKVNTVITNNIEANSVIDGNPSKKIGERFTNFDK